MIPPLQHAQAAIDESTQIPPISQTAPVFNTTNPMELNAAIPPPVADTPRKNHSSSCYMPSLLKEQDPLKRRLDSCRLFEKLASILPNPRDAGNMNDECDANKVKFRNESPKKPPRSYSSSRQHLPPIKNEEMIKLQGSTLSSHVRKPPEKTSSTPVLSCNYLINRILNLTSLHLPTGIIQNIIRKP
jgi:hypothetical protein